MALTILETRTNFVKLFFPPQRKCWKKFTRNRYSFKKKKQSNIEKCGESWELAERKEGKFDAKFKKKN